MQIKWTTLKSMTLCLILLSLAFSNSRVAFSRPGDMMRIPSMAYEKNSPTLFTVDVNSEILNFSSENRAYSGTVALNFQRKGGLNFGLTANRLSNPVAIKEAGFHFQKTVFKYGDVTFSAGIHDFLYMRDGNDVIRVNDISFFGLFTSYKEFENYSLSIHFGGGTGKIQYDPQTTDDVDVQSAGGFLGFSLKTSYFEKNGGLDFMMEYIGTGVNIGCKVPITDNYTMNLGMTHFENLSEFASESKTGKDRKELQFNAPAISIGFSIDIPNLYKEENQSISQPFDAPESIGIGDTEDLDAYTAIHQLRDSLNIAMFENRNLYDENLFLKHQIAVLNDSTRTFHLEREVDKSNLNLILRHISRSLRHFYAEEYREALAEIDLAIEVNPNLALAYARRGSIYYRLGDFQRATMNWNIALKLDPEFTEIQDLLKASKENRLSTAELDN